MSELDSESYWSETSFQCCECAENFVFMDDAFAITVARVLVTNQGLIYDPLVCDDGDFLYEPLFMCVACWESAVSDLKEKMDDIPPVEDLYAVHECSICSSGIRNGEVLGIAAMGTMLLAERSPSGASEKFEISDPDPIALCIGCINIMNEEVCGLWADEDNDPEPIMQNGECKEGSYARCWRVGCPADGNCGREGEE